MPSRPWWATALVYQLYVRSFSDSDGDGIGDLAGIRQRLGYLAELGLDALWLNPCYPSPQRDHGYDVADYFNIEPAYGDLAEFDLLVADARRHGIRILMDVVPNHCSSEHAWFKAAVAGGPGCPERERFYFREGLGPDGDEPPNNWRAIFGGSTWTRVTEPDGSPGQWYLAVFTPDQPDFNWDHPEVAEYFDRMLRFWFDRGVEGFRADAVAVVGKTPGLPDEPLADRLARHEIGDGNVHFTYRPEGHTAWRRWRRVFDEYEREHPGRSLVCVAEAYAPKRPDVVRQYVNRQEFHQVFAFDLLLAPWNAGAFRVAIRSTMDALAPEGLLPTWTLNNHDTQRNVTRYGRLDATSDASYTGGNLINSTAGVDVAMGTRRARAAVVLQLALPGAIYLYAGEELGLPEVLDLADDARQDPIWFRTEGREIGRDGCRVPLPWSADGRSSFGFSPADPVAGPWLPQPPEWGRLAAANQAQDPASMLSLYRRASALRRSTTVLSSDAFGWELDGDPDLLAFHRGDVLVVTNASGHPRSLPPGIVGDRSVLLSSEIDHDDPTTLPADCTVWLS